MKKIVNGDCHLVYITPESLMSRKRRQMLCASHCTQCLKAVVFDEATALINDLFMVMLLLNNWNYTYRGNLIGSLLYMLGKFVASCLLRYLYCY